jgi:hypothetical protein
VDVVCMCICLFVFVVVCFLGGVVWMYVYLIH